METVIYNQTGKEVGKLKLPESIFGLPWNADLVHQVAVSMESNKRSPVAHAKDRSAVSGGGKKPWRQKGTGRARHGSIRSPLWIGGGVTHGPLKEKVFARKINRTMKAKALFAVLSKKLKDREIIFVDAISLKNPKTKEAKVVLESLSGIEGLTRLAQKKMNALFISLPKKDESVERSFRNFSFLEMGEVRNLNILDILNAKYLLMVNPEESIKTLEAKIEAKKL